MRKKRWTKILFSFIGFILVVTTTTIALASTGHSSLKGNLEQRLETFMDQKALSDHFNGVVLVAKDGKTIFEKGYGYANKEAGISNGADAEFKIASLTKSFTAVSILQLEEQGKLRTTDPVSKYIPGFPNGDKVTIHSLLTHSSGVKDHAKLTDTTKPITLSAFIDLMKKQTLLFEPGSQYKYSNTGYMILAYIVEKVSGQSYGNYYNEHIFKPAGMQHTYLRKVQAKNFAIGYENMKPIIDNDDESQLAGAGDIISTAGDMQKYINALNKHQLLNKVETKKMETGYIDSSEWGIFKYGYGWNVADNIISFDRPMIEHNGNLPGYKSDVADFPEDHVTVILLSNNHGAWSTGPLTRELASICLDKRYWYIQNDF
ncbi:beta-lactamase family protein [Bacillus sp. BRMEA1]|uniref:serine hydrolase domain-containing protein n=1 Tax=Neobacillus endophyticus TaxID=2738405 RepID=UPI001566778F|nr:serine hydrolase domain-containing protein [Neobacillus endophyticus]NRD77672.1 beta-lactamase family protein [Neobacillus endophyticus]